jgi:hypothetical protein
VQIGTNVQVAAGTISVLDASDTQKGVVELATLAEAATGTDATRALTPESGVAKSASGVTGAAILPNGTAASAPAGAAGYARIANDLGQLTFFANGAYFPIGFGAGGSTTNTAAGLAALDSNTGTNNTAFGNNALTANTTGVENTATGSNALAANTTGCQNTATGANALAANQTGVANTAAGFNALAANTTGNLNVAIGRNSMCSAVSGCQSVGVGANTLRDNQGNYNTAVGASALLLNTTGANNTATGRLALAANTTGINNTATGFCALACNQTGINNTATGANALSGNLGGIWNTAHGVNALLVNSSGQCNTAIGGQALSGNTTGCNNIAIGQLAGCALTIGDGNTIIGANIVGSAGWSDTLAIGSGGSLVITGSPASGTSFYPSNGAISITNNANGAPAGSVMITSGPGIAFGVYTGQGTFGQYLSGASSAWNAISDERAKDELEPITDGLNKVATLRAVTGIYKNDEDKNRQVFLIAQDVQKVLPEAVDATDPEKLGLAYTDVIPLLVSALHDAKDRIEALEAEVAALKGA